MNLSSTLQKISPELILSLADTFIQQQAWEKARMTLITFLDSMPAKWSPLSIEAKGKAVYAVWNHAEKLALTHSVRERVNGSKVQVSFISYSKAMFLMAQIALHEQKIEEAATWNEKGLELEADHPELWIQKGHIYKHLRRFPTAYKAFKHAMNARPWQENTTKAKAARGAGIVLAELHQPQAAIDMLQESLRLDPGNEHTMNELSGLYLERSVTPVPKAVKKPFWKRFK
ncbi:MAG: hypothetical protein AAF824_08525 [Bacteroidota bacterium]